MRAEQEGKDRQGLVLGFGVMIVAASVALGIASPDARAAEGDGDLYPLPAPGKWPNNAEGDNLRMLDGSPRTVFVDPGASFEVDLTFQRWENGGCGIVSQVFLILGWTPSWPPPPGYYIGLYNGQPCPDPGVTMSTTVSLTAPTTPGTYYLYLGASGDFSVDQGVKIYTNPLVPRAHFKVVVGGSGEWAYSLPVTITNPGAALASYQVPVVLDPASLVAQGKMRADCGDVRFRGADGAALHHWREGPCGPGATTFWVRVPALPAGSTLILASYGNPGATSASSLRDTVDPVGTFASFAGNWRFPGPLPGEVSGWEPPLTQIGFDDSEWGFADISNHGPGGAVTSQGNTRVLVRKEFFLSPGTVAFTFSSDDRHVWTLIHSSGTFVRISGDEGATGPGATTGPASFSVQAEGRFVWAGRANNCQCLGGSLSIESIDAGLSQVFVRQQVEPVPTIALGIEESGAPLPHLQAVLSGLPGGAGWWRSPVAVALVSKAGSPPIAGIQHRLDGGGWQADTNPLRVDAEGPHLLEFKATGTDGREGPASQVELNVDTVPPIGMVSFDTPPNPASWWRGPVRATFRGEDPAPGSGYRHTVASVDGNPWLRVESVVIAGDGAHSLCGQAIDAAGNQETPRCANVQVDTTPPLVELESPLADSLYLGDLRVAPVQNHTLLIGEHRVEAGAADATSGGAHVEFYVDGELRAVDPAPPYAWLWDTTHESGGLHRLEVRAMDHAGNPSVPATRDVLTVPASQEGATATAMARAPPEGVESTVTAGPDQDHDGVPATLDVWDPVARNYMRHRPDPDDQDPEVPVPSHFAVPFLPLVQVGPDEDEDGLPSTLGLTPQQLVVDRRVENGDAPAVEQGDAIPVGLDPEDTEPCNPIFCEASLFVPTGVQPGPDSDGDLVPDHVGLVGIQVDADRRGSPLVAWGPASMQVPLDPP